LVGIVCEVQELFRYAELDLGQTSKQRDLQEVLDLLIRQSNEEIKRAKFILTEFLEINNYSNSNSIQFKKHSMRYLRTLQKHKIL
jgi:hypothetical protein